MASTIDFRVVSVGDLQTNCYVVWNITSKQAMLIDPGAQPEKIQQVIDENLLDVQFIVNTHGHGDHISANNAFNVDVYIHENDAPCLIDPFKNLSGLMGVPFQVNAASRILHDNDVIILGDIEFTVIHTPGHAQGCICLYTEGFLFSGDTLFYEGIGRTDLPGGSYQQEINSIKNRLFVLPDETKVFPGHGPATTIGHEKETGSW